MRDDMEYISQLLEKIEKGLGEIYDFRQVLKETVEKIDKRMLIIETSIEEIKKNPSTQINEKLKLIEKEIEKTQEAVEKIDKKINEDSKFLEGTYIELKEHINITDEKFKEMQNEINTVQKNTEKSNKILKLLGELIKTING